MEGKKLIFVWEDDRINYMSSFDGLDATAFELFF